MITKWAKTGAIISLKEVLLNMLCGQHITDVS